MIRRFVVLVLLLGGAVLIEPLRVATEGVTAPKSLFLFGVLLLAADSFGALMHGLRMPRIVGYMLAGLALGPSVSDMVPGSVLHDLGLMKELALGLIGLLAGVELRLGDLRQRWRSMLGVVGGQTVVVIVVVLLAIVIGRDWIPFVAGMAWGPLLLVGLIFATMMALNSPMVTIALLTETRATGPVAKTTLGVVLLADVLGIVLFTLALSLAQGTFGRSGVPPGAVLGSLLWQITLSILAGAIIAGIATLYLRFVRLELVLVAVVLVFVTTALARALHFEVLLSLLVAGFLVENLAPVRASSLVRALEQIGSPVFVVFFALAGAELDLGHLEVLWPLVLGFVVVRMSGLYAGAWLGARLGGAEPVVQRDVWLGLVSQAGVALGLVVIVADRFPGLGAALQATVVGVIAINQALGPILFRLALARSGEMGAGQGTADTMKDYNKLPPGLMGAPGG